MSKIYTRFLLTAVMLMVSVIASAYDFEVDGILYNILSEEDKTCEVTNDFDTGWYQHYSGDVHIPECVEFNNISYTVTGIGMYAFEGCYDITSIYIPRTVVSIADKGFAWGNDLKKIVVDEGNTVYDSRDNCNALIETASNTLLQGCCNTVIPTGVTAIGDDAFCGLSGLTSITIPTGVTSIGDFAFSNSSLTSIDIPNGVTSIGMYAFYCCYDLTSVTMPTSVTSIGEQAFYVCSGITSITIPSGVTNIEDMTFTYCVNLVSITDLAKQPQTLGTDALAEISHDAVLHVLPGCKAAYEAADVWKDFTIVEDAVDPTGIEQIENGKLKIGNSAVYNLSGQRISAAKKGVDIIGGKKIFSRGD